MHPVLFEIPIPPVGLPLAPSLVVLAFAFAIVAMLGRRARARDLTMLGVVSTVAALVAALLLHGRTATLEAIPVYGFGTMLCFGLFGGWYACAAHAERDGLPRDAVAGTYVVAAVAGLLGARLLYVLTNFGDFGAMSEAFAFRSGGLVFYGGVLAGGAGSFFYARRRRLRWLSWADAAAPSLAFGSAVGRLGCYMAGCDYGLPLGAHAPRWLVRLGTFPRWPDTVAGPGAGSPAWVDQVLYRGLPIERATAMPVHPTELYEALASLAIATALLALRTRRSFHGQLFLTFVGAYAAGRFLLEMLRDDPERGAFGPFSTSQWIAMATAIVGAFVWRRLAVGTAHRT